MINDQEVPPDEVALSLINDSPEAHHVRYQEAGGRMGFAKWLAANAPQQRKPPATLADNFALYESAGGTLDFRQWLLETFPETREQR